MEAWLTDSNEVTPRPLARVGDVSFGSTQARVSVGTAELRLREDEVYQEIEGFGGALTEAAVMNILGLQGAQRNTFLRDVFDPREGMGFGYVRVPIGASDFAEGDYTYDDLPAGQEDPELAHFSIERDRKTLDLIREIRSINPELKILLSPWSPPAWMKANGASVNGGQLDPLRREVYSRYLVRTLQEYERAGVAADSFTIQNEPLNPTHYPSMFMSAREQAEIIREHLGPLLQEAGIRAKLLIYDHNWDRPDYPLEILNDPVARAYVGGIAFHGYAGEPEQMRDVTRAFPQFPIYQTETCCAEMARDPAFPVTIRDLMPEFMKTAIMPTLREGSSAYMVWNLALDETNGPRNRGWEGVRPLITIRRETGAIEPQPEYYAIGHLSRFVPPGSRRIGVEAVSPPGVADSIHSLAFKTPEGNAVLVVLNDGTQSAEVSVADPRCGHAVVRIPSRSIATYRW